MEGSEGSLPCMILAAELYPKSQMEKEDTQLMVPFQELAGESVKYLGRTDDGVLALSNYRIFLLKNSNNSETSVPLGLIESAQSRDLFHLIVNGKDASTVKCSFETAEQCSEWQRRIQLSVGVPESLESLFAFPFCSWTCDGMTNGSATQNGGGGPSSMGGGFADNPSSVCSGPDYSERLQRASRYEDDFMREVERLGFDLNGSWRISHANGEFKLCPSYPRQILVPCCISDETLNTVANFRGSRRLPAVVWRHRKSGAVIARCSQPEVGWLGWRSSKDEQLLKALADACAFDRGEQMRRLTQVAAGQTVHSGESSPSSPDGSHEELAFDEVRKVLIVDARSYTSAVTNRARGGGCECIEYYPCAEIEFMNLGNIHVIRKSFQSLRQLCASPPDVPNWLGLLEKTMWLQHLSGLLAASMTVCHAVEKKGRPVLVHCSDGWDRTPQIVATAQLCLDPYYRTVEGFRILVEREWLSYGHKFADRCGHGPGSDELNERCPVFLQWLDLVHQIHKQFPCSFEFSMGYLIKLAQHSLSCLFGTFFCNTLKERIDNSVFERTFSVWPFLSGPIYRNALYVPNREKVLWPAHNVRDLYLWTEVYLGSLGNQNCIDFPSSNVDGLHGSMSPMAKTRSYGDLITAGIIQNGISRRSSDPNMTVDPNLTIGSNSENNSVADIQSEREDSPDIIANLIHDTTRKLQNLTIELNNHDEENFQCLQQKHEETMQELLEHQQQQQASTNADDKSSKAKSTNDSPFFSSPQIMNFNQMDCDLYETSRTVPLTSVSCAVAATLPGTEMSANAASDRQNGFNGLLKTLDDITNGDTGSSRSHINDGVEQGAVGITIHKPAGVNSDLMQSVDLGDPAGNELTSCSDRTTAPNSSDNQQNMWHGSVNTSTDTLVPIENRQQNATTNGNCDTVDELCDVIDGGCTSSSGNCLNEHTESKHEHSREHHKQSSSGANTLNSNSTNYCSILPKVHSSINSNSSRPNVLSTSFSNASVSSTSSSLNNLNTISNNINTNNHSLANNNGNNNSCDNNFATPAQQETAPPATFPSTNANPMEESILILPEHPKLEISISGKCETVLNNVAMATAQGGVPTAASATPFSYSYGPFSTASAQRRRRTSSSNSRRDGLIGKQANGSTISRFSLPGVRSLPMTPPGLPERPQIAISCPDGLAHALSEQNIRLQQIVHEHKLREDVLLREIHDMRMALLKKICPNCNNAPATNDEQADEFLNANRRLFDLCKCCTLCATCSNKSKRRHRRHHRRSCNEDSNDDDDCDDACSSISACSALDNVENASICSWEAVEDRSGPSSCTSSSIQPNATSVLWVPDHAVSRCTSCQTEFWLGRRKHHCRSCGQIFCADCSEFWAPLPDEKLFSPVRLCGPCYHSVTTRMQQQTRSYIATSSNTSSTNATMLSSAPMLQQRQQTNVASLATLNGQIDSNNMSQMLLLGSTGHHDSLAPATRSSNNGGASLEACNHAATHHQSQHAATAMNVTTAAATN